MSVSAAPTSPLGLERHHSIECIMFKQNRNGVDEDNEVWPVKLVRGRGNRHGIAKGMGGGHPGGRRVDGTGTFRCSERTIGLEYQRSGRGHVPSDKLLEVINRLAVRGNQR